MQASHDQQSKAHHTELEEMRKRALDEATSASAASAAAQSDLRKQIAALKSSVSAQQNQAEEALQSKSATIASAQQRTSLLEAELEGLKSQLSVAAAESKSKDQAVQQCHGDSLKLQNELAASQSELQAVSSLLKSRDDTMRINEQAVFDLENEISGLKHDFEMFGKMMKGQGLSEQQLTQMHPVDGANAQHMEIFRIICNLNDLVICANQSKASPSLAENLLHVETLNRTLTDKLKETESCLTVELERSWEIAKKVAEIEEERNSLIAAATETASLLASKDEECSRLLSQLSELKQQSRDLDAPIVACKKEAQLTTADTSSDAHASRVLQNKNLEISELKIQLSTLKIEIDRLSGAHAQLSSQQADRGSTSIKTGIASLPSGKDSVNVHYSVPSEELDSETAPQHKHNPLELTRTSSSSLSEQSDTPRVASFEGESAEWRYRCEKAQSQNEVLTSHVKALYSEIKVLRLQQCSDAELVQKLSDMETLNVEIMKRSAEAVISKQIADSKLDAAQMVIQHLKKCTLELDAQVVSLQGQLQDGRDNIGTKGKSQSLNTSAQTEHHSLNRLQDDHAAHSEVRVLSRILNETIAASEQKEFDLRLQLSQQSGRIIELEAQFASASGRNVAAEVNALASARDHQEVESLRLQVAELTDQLKHLETQVSSANKAAADAKALADDESVRADGIESSCRISTEALTARALAAETDATNAQQRASAAETDATNAQERANSLSARVVELEKSCNELSDAVTDLNEKLAISSNELKAVRAQFEDEKSRATANLDRITVELERFQSESDSNISGLKCELTSAAKENDVLRFNVQELQSQLDVVTHHRASVVHKAAEFSAHTGQFKLRVTELESQLSTAQSQIASSAHDAARADSIIIELKAQLAMAQHDAETSRQSVDDLRARVTHLDALYDATKGQADASEINAAAAKASASAESARVAAIECEISDKERLLLNAEAVISGIREELSAALKQCDEN